MREYYHLGRLADEKAKCAGQEVVLSYRDDEKGVWLPVCWRDFARQVDALACRLIAERVEVQENMAVFTQNMPESLITDFAAFDMRAVTIPLYATSSESQVTYILNDASVRLLFVGEQHQYDVAMRVIPLCPTLEKIIIFDKKVKKAPHDSISVYFADFVAGEVSNADKKTLQERKTELCETDIANILYTSGTTGDPKGVMIHHSCWMAQFKSHYEVLGQHLFLPGQRSMDFLPLTHVFERGWTYLCMEAGVQICVNRDPHEILRSIQEVRPTMMCAVPRFWEKVYDGVQAKIVGFSPMLQKIIAEALKVGKAYNLDYLDRGKHPSMMLTLKYKMYEKSIFRMLKKAIGLENGVFFPVAGAAIPPAIQEFIRSVGINLIPGYGLTESSATVSCAYGKISVGSIGRPLPGIEVKIGENDEIMVRAASITHGYYRKPEATKAAFDEDGYFHTGDAGYIKEGELYITDRIKDLFKTSNGKYIAPQVLEGLFCVDKYIDQVVIIADKRKFVSALVIPNYEEVARYADENGIPYADIRQLVANERVKEMIFHRMDTLQQQMAAYEKVKRITLLPEPFTMESGVLTNTLKVKRPVVAEKYKDLIDKMYE